MLSILMNSVTQANESTDVDEKEVYHFRYPTAETQETFTNRKLGKSKLAKTKS